MNANMFIWIVSIAAFLLTIVQCKENNVDSINVKLYTDHVEPFIVVVEKKTVFQFNVSLAAVKTTEKLEDAELFVSVDDDNLVDIVSDRIMKVNEGEENNTLSVVLEGELPGRTKLIFKVLIKNNSSITIKSYAVFVERRERVIDRAFTGVVITLVVLANIGMGCKVDLSVVKATLKRPVAPAIGLCSQFLFMPLIGFALAYSLPLEPGTALGLFALGCSPGGSASNIFTNFLNGNVSLSVTMTLISSLAALGFIPFWLFSLGQLIYLKGNIKIPFSNIVISLIGIIAPIVIGLVLQHKLPKAAGFFIKSVKYIMVVFFIFVFTVGIYANVYVFYILSSEIILASAFLPYLGFIFGGLFAFLTKRERPDIVAIALETGIQNTGIPIILCQLSLSGPDRDTSIVSPIISAIFTPIPIAIAILYVQIKAWRERKDEDTKSEVAFKDHDLEWDTEFGWYS